MQLVPLQRGGAARARAIQAHLGHRPGGVESRALHGGRARVRAGPGAAVHGEVHGGAGLYKLRMQSTHSSRKRPARFQTLNLSSEKLV
jgi:hypothetical protein